MLLFLESALLIAYSFLYATPLSLCREVLSFIDGIASQNRQDSSFLLSCSTYGSKRHLSQEEAKSPDTTQYVHTSVSVVEACTYQRIAGSKCFRYVADSLTRTTQPRCSSQVTHNLSICWLQAEWRELRVVPEKALPGPIGHSLINMTGIFEYKMWRDLKII